MPRQVIGIALLAALGCGGKPASSQPEEPRRVAPKPRPPDPVLFIPGERIDWAVSWLDVKAAEFSLSVGDVERTATGQRLVEVRTDAESTGLLARVGAHLRGTATTTIDLNAGGPVAVAGTFDDVYSGAVLRGDERDVKTPIPWDAQLPGGGVVHDTHSGLGRLRGFRGDTGATLRYYGKIQGSIWSVDAVARDIETIETAAGPKRARLLDCSMAPVDEQLKPAHWDRPYPFQIWITDDEHRVPARIKVDSRLGGVVVFDLDAYREGKLSDVNL